MAKRAKTRTRSFYIEPLMKALATYSNTDVRRHVDRYLLLVRRHL